MSNTTTRTAPDGDHPWLEHMLLWIREETADTRGLLPSEVVESQALCATLEEVTNRLLHLHKPLRSSDEDVATTSSMDDDDDTQHFVFYSPPASPTPTLPSSDDDDDVAVEMDDVDDVPPPPLPVPAVVRHPIHRYNKKLRLRPSAAYRRPVRETCVICMTAPVNVNTGCFHKFCLDCIVRQSETTSVVRCSVCRADVEVLYGLSEAAQNQLNLALESRRLVLNREVIIID